MKKTKKPTNRIKTMVDAAQALKTSRKTLETWRSAGCPGLPPKRFNPDAVIEWADANGKRAINATGNELRATKTLEEIRKLKIRNDRDEGKVTENSKILESFARLAGRVNAYRLKSEAEDPVELDKVEGISAKRQVMRRIWVEIMKALQACGDEFKR